MTETLPATPSTWRLRLWTAVAWLPQWAVVLLAIILLLAATAWGLLSPIIRERQAILRLNSYPGVRVIGGQSKPGFVFCSMSGPPSPPPLWDQAIAQLTGDGTWLPKPIIVLTTPKTPPEALRHLERLRSIEKIMLAGPQWTDKELAELTTRYRFGRLEIFESSITPAGWRALERLPLVALDVQMQSIGPEFLHIAQTMPHLEELTFEGPAITNADLKSLSGHPTLNDLTIWETRVTSDCIETLATLPDLTQLRIDSTGINDGFLKELGRLGKLKGLSVSGTKITDAGLAAIPATVHLEQLYVEHTAITEAGLLSLRNVPTDLSFLGTNVRLTEPLKRWLLSHPFDSVYLDESMLDPASAMAKELSDHIGYLHIQPAASPTDE
jgi:predicted small integral membrane protein